MAGSGTAQKMAPAPAHFAVLSILRTSLIGMLRRVWLAEVPQGGEARIVRAHHGAVYCVIPHIANHIHLFVHYAFQK